MTIAINSNHLMKPGRNDPFYDYFVTLAQTQPGHQFIFIGLTASGGSLSPAQNIIQVASSPIANNPLMWKVWLDYTLPAITRKYRANLLIHTGGACSLRIKIPQWLIIQDLSFLSVPQFFSKKQQQFLKKNMPGFLTKATKIITPSDFLTKSITKHYAVGAEKITRFYLMGDPRFQPMSWKEKEGVKEKYAGGKEYFLFTGEIDPRNNLINLLKAFSFFKKRQKSNMQLLILPTAVAPGDNFIENLKTYKYRKEVIVLTDLALTEQAKITAAAYAFIYTSISDDTAQFPLQAMQSEVPVITADTGAMAGIAGDAAIYTDPVDYEDIADKMMLLFKDEAKRTELIKKGKLVIQTLQKKGGNESIWGSILRLNNESA